MIDVVFLLLMFFMVTSTFLETPGINLDLPDAESSVNQKSDDLTLVIDESNNIYFRGHQIKKVDFRTELKESLATNKTKTLIIQADEKTGHGMVVYFMDIARLSGIKNLVIATESKI